LYKTITLISCPNGFGHFYRLLKLAFFLKKKKYIVNFICSDEQKNKVSNLSNLNFFKFYTNKNLKKNPYNFLLKFYNLDLEKYSFINKSDIIISDNLLNRIYTKKKFFLISNFLWSEFNYINKKSRNSYKKIEKTFIKKNKFIFQNRYFNSDKKLDSLKVNFFGKSLTNNKIIRGKIFYYHSKNDKIQSEYLKLLNNYEIYSNNLNLTKKFSNIKHLKTNQFHKYFNRFEFILSKPGLSTITDSITYKIPLISFKDNDNDVELKYNLKKIVKYKIGYVLGKNKERNLIDLCDNTNYLIYKKNLKSFKFNGEEKIFEKIKSLK
jgi:UDP-N-acetylglucosamine:LPS N-acetylglucosamine transferase